MAKKKWGEDLRSRLEKAIQVNFAELGLIPNWPQALSHLLDVLFEIPNLALIDTEKVLKDHRYLDTGDRYLSSSLTCTTCSTPWPCPVITFLAKHTPTAIADLRYPGKVRKVELTDG